MSGFDKDWLTLREPADSSARAQPMLDKVYQYLDALPKPHIIMDVGCGTGSTYRTLSSALPHVRWRLLDYETVLLEEAQRQVGPNATVEFYRQDLNKLDETLLDGVSLVTASALFDLCSSEFCDSFLEKLSNRHIGLYAALNYNGVMEWSISHPLDRQVVKDFNLHQRSDKGFGPALGPGASSYLSARSEAFGFLVKTADSPWRLDKASPELQKQFLAGLQRPIREIGNINDAQFEQWFDFRRSNIGVDGSFCIVGHTDVLAFPGT